MDMRRVIAGVIVQAEAGSAWDGTITGMSFNQSFSITSQDDRPTGIYFKPDGTKMYLMGFRNDKIHQYSLSTAWDVSTASYDSKSFTATAGYPRGVWISSDGTKVFYTEVNNDRIYRADMSTAWDISTASAHSSADISAQSTTSRGAYLSADGTKVYISDLNDDLYQYSMSTAFDLSTLSYVRTKSLTASNTQPYGIWANSDGDQFYIADPDNAQVERWSLSTAWDISTMSIQEAVTISASTPNPRGIYIDPDEKKLYVACDTNDTVDEWDLP